MHYYTTIRGDNFDLNLSSYSDVFYDSVGSAKVTTENTGFDTGYRYKGSVLYLIKKAKIKAILVGGSSYDESGMSANSGWTIYGLAVEKGVFKSNKSYHCTGDVSIELPGYSYPVHFLSQFIWNTYPDSYDSFYNKSAFQGRVNNKNWEGCRDADYIITGSPERNVGQGLFVLTSKMSYTKSAAEFGFTSSSVVNGKQQVLRTNIYIRDSNNNVICEIKYNFKAQKRSSVEHYFYIEGNSGSTVYSSDSDYPKMVWIPIK